MKLKDKPVYPIYKIDHDIRASGIMHFLHLKKEPINYREWLIGMLASNPEMMSKHEEFDFLIDKDITAKNLVKQADAIIKEMEA